MQVGYTQYGPQRADIVIKCNKIPVAHVFSRGQQKLFALALLLAQGLFLRECAQKSCIYLIDDLSAELDRAKQELVSTVLHQLRAQVFVTGVELAGLQGLVEAQESQLFQVKNSDLGGTIDAQNGQIMV